MYITIYYVYVWILFYAKIFVAFFLINFIYCRLNKKNVENIHLNYDEIHPCTAAAVIEILNEQGMIIISLYFEKLKLPYCNIPYKYQKYEQQFRSKSK